MVTINQLSLTWIILFSSLNLLITESKFLDDIENNWKGTCFDGGINEKGDCDKLKFPEWMDQNSIYKDRATCRKFHRLGCFYGKQLRLCDEIQATNIKFNLTSSCLLDSLNKFAEQVDSNSISFDVNGKLCDQGYRAGVSGNCEDINECNDRNVTCPVSNCHNFPGGFKCCPNGAEIDHKNECIFIDQCEKNPCPQSITNDKQFWCVNYYTDRECISKSVEGYLVMDRKNNILQLIDWKNKSLPRYLESSKIEITLKGESELFQNQQLIKLQLQQGFNCDWKLNLDQVWSTVEDNQINESQFVKISEQFNCFVYMNGLIKLQSLAVSLTCNINYQPYYQNTIYITFKPQLKK